MNAMLAATCGSACVGFPGEFVAFDRKTAYVL